jgi:hypothetical protein
VGTHSSPFSAMSRTTRLASLSLLALPLLALAQTSVPVPASSCSKPVLPAIDSPMDDKAAKKLNADSTAYAACVETYMKERRAVAEEHRGIFEANANAANAAAKEFNNFSTELTALSAARADKTKKK